MKPKMKCSTSKTSPAKLNRKASQKKVEEICHKYYMKLRSGLTIEKKACYYRKELTKACALKTGKKHTNNYRVLTTCVQPGLLRSFSKAHVFQDSTSSTGGTPSVEESCACLSTYNDRFISFVEENGCYTIVVEELDEDKEKDEVRLRYYEAQNPSKGSGDEVDNKLLMVNMSPTKDKDVWLHANKKECSVKLQKCESTLPDQAFFVLHRESSEFVSFECKSNRGTYLGIKDNQLALVEGKNPTRENIMFKLSQT